MNGLFFGLIGLALGGATGFFVRKLLADKTAAEAEKKAADVLRNAKTQEQETLLKAKEEAIHIAEAARKEEQQIRAEIKAAQKRIEEREERFEHRLNNLEEDRKRIDADKQRIQEKEEELALVHSEAVSKLEEVAGLTRDEALHRLMTDIEQDKQEELLGRIRKLDQEHEEAIEAKARKILSLAVQRFASSHVVDSTTTMVELPSEDMKGRIIGKEGRNIKALERLTGCEIIIDDQPGMVTISGFSPVRRQIAKQALEALMKDGRIQPARIEESVNDAKKNLAKEMRKAGEEALYELGIPVSSIDPKLISILGRLKFRTSYGQNVLQHSIEVARISGMIAEELGADVFNCKKGGLFHDIGKAVDHDMQGAHPEIGYNIMKKFGFSEDLCYQSIAHHEDKPRTIEGVIVKAADAISGARPGARRNSVEDYLQRLQALEDTANEFAGVDKAYAIQAGREVRVFVRPTEVNDYDAYKLANQIAKKIENDLTYPGEVKVTIIRETRISEVAR